MVNKTKVFQNLHQLDYKNLYMSKWNTDEILLFTLYGKLRVSSKKGINKICKGNVFFYKYVHIIISLQMKKNVFFLYIKTNNV
jgi:hypothetical protein